MPIYEYECKMCKREFEYFHFNTEDKRAYCPYCNGYDLNKLPSRNTGFELKGRGWAKDKYSGKNKK